MSPQIPPLHSLELNSPHPLTKGLQTKAPNDIKFSYPTQHNTPTNLQAQALKNLLFIKFNLKSYGYNC